MLDVTQALNAYSTSKVGGLKNLSKEDAKLKEQTNAFESVLVKQMLDVAMDEKYSLFPSEAGKEIYKSMYTDAISGAVSGNFGFSELLFNYLKERN